MTTAATATYLILIGSIVAAFIGAYPFSKSIVGHAIAVLGIVATIGISALIFHRVA